MAISQKLKNCIVIKDTFPFQEREVDWWFITLLPILLIVLSGVIYYQISKDFKGIIIVSTQQLLTYSIILSSTDLGLKFRSKEKYVMAHPFLLILSSFTVLVCIYISQTDMLRLKIILYLYFLIALITCYLSIVLYNNNPFTNFFDSSIFTKVKSEREEESKREFESPDKPKTQFEGKWGEDA